MTKDTRSESSEFHHQLREEHKAKPTGQLNWAWREFIKNVSVPTREEIFEFHKHTPFKHGWTHVQMLQFGYRKKLPTKPIVEKEVAA